MNPPFNHLALLFLSIYENHRVPLYLRVPGVWSTVGGWVGGGVIVLKNNPRKRIKNTIRKQPSLGQITTVTKSMVIFSETKIRGLRSS